jgi:PhnB protein
MAETMNEPYSPVSPYLMVHDGAGALDFYQRALRAEVRETYPYEGKLGHATLRINGADVMLSDEFPEHIDLTGTKSPKTLGGTAVTISLAVEDVDMWFDRAIAAGATPLRRPQDEFYGRMGKLRDPFGHVWSFTGPTKESRRL